MSYGRVYVWTPDSREPLGGCVERRIVPLQSLMEGAQGKPRLSGRLVAVRNGGWVNVSDDATGEARAVPIGDAEPDENGDFLFEPGRGGGRMDKVMLPEPDFRGRYIQASHFGEVNTYYHLHLIASYVEGLLDELQAPRLPQVIALVNAHHAATEQDGIRDGDHDSDRWKAFQGGHYRLPGGRFHIDELERVAETGEIHLGPGRQLLTDGALVKAFVSRYRANASHNAGIIYHEYGHHIARHTADFRANGCKSPQRQNNRKAAIDEGMCDYWTAVMLETPHIWAWHRRHDGDEVHPRSLVSRETMDDFDTSAAADPHTNGTVWAAALWDLRSRMLADGGARKCDLLVMKAMLLIGQMEGESVREIRRLRADYSRALAALIRSDQLLYGGQHQSPIRDCFAKRKIVLAEDGARGRDGVSSQTPVAHLLKRVSAEDIPSDTDICSAQELEDDLANRNGPPISVLAVGDIMLGDRTRGIIREEGADYPFAGVLPLLRRAEIVFGNLEGPFAREAEKIDRNFSYRVNPNLASALARANIKVVTLANNHLTDCGRGGVLETLAALSSAGVAAVGAAENQHAAHRPVILQAGRWRVGVLGYYWNRRTAATRALPGSAMDTAEDLIADIGALRGQVDRIVVEFHWGIPYQREPLAEDREKARFAIACGADVVVGHHPHVIQPFEIYRGCPILYSVGNFTFGSGNSRAEGLVAGLRFGEEETEVEVYPIYVKNRDPRVSYQPKVLRGEAGRRILKQLAEMSGEHGPSLTIEPLRATMRLPRPTRKGCCA